MAENGLPAGAVRRNTALPAGAVRRPNPNEPPAGATLRSPTPAPVDARTASVPNIAMEGVSAVNRVAAPILDIATSPIQALLSATGVDVPSFSSGVAPKGAYTGGGLATEAISAGVELGALAIPIGAGTRVASKAIQQATMLGEGVLKRVLTSMGQTTLKQDAIGGVASGVVGVGTGEAAADVFGEEWRGTGEVVGQVLAPSAWLHAADRIAQSVTSAAPTTQHIRGASKALYELLEDAGLEASEGSVRSMSKEVAAFVAENGLTSAGTTGPLASNMQRIMKELEAGRMTYNMLDNISTRLRKMGSAADDTAAGLATDGADMLDDMIYRLVPTNATALKGRSVKETLDSARDFWRRGKVSKAYEDAFERATTEATIQRKPVTPFIKAELKKLAKPSHKQNKFMNAEERRQLNAAIKGSTLEQSLDVWGGYLGINSQDYTKNLIVGMLATGGVGIGYSAAGNAGAAGVGGALLFGALLGKGLKATSNRLFSANANLLRATMASGRRAPQIIHNYNRFVQPSERNARDLASLLLHNNADLSALPSNLKRVPWLADSIYMATIGQQVLTEARQEQEFGAQPPD